MELLLSDKAEKIQGRSNVGSLASMTGYSGKGCLSAARPLRKNVALEEVPQNP
jgi:hypothetical protein